MTSRAALDAAALDAEIDGMLRLLGVMRAEQDALRRADADALGPIVSAKLKVLADLEQLGNGRMSALPPPRTPRRARDIDTWLDTQPATAPLRQRLQRLLALAAEAQALNQSSRRLAIAQRRHFERASAALLRATGRDDVYGADGRTQRLSIPPARAAV